MASAFHIGQRLSYDSALCTVQYIGAVRGTENDWLGVEWDDPTRGKHNGEHKGVRYFSCRSRFKTPASFVRPSRRSDPVQSFVEAVDQKYASEFTERRDALGVLTEEVEISRKIVYEVGFDKIRAQLAQLHELKIVIVDAYRITSAEVPDRLIQDICSKIIELDLSRNLFESCKEIIHICGQLDNLRSLRISGNRLQIKEEEFSSQVAVKSFQGISDLGLDEMLISWDDACYLARQFQDLTVLSLCSNSLSSLPKSLYVPLLPSGVKSLTLEYNSFFTLADLAPLTSLMALETLHLKGNQIEAIHRGSESDGLVFGDQLRYVDLSYNNITTWAFVDSLPDVFPGLKGLRFSHNPIYESMAQRGDNATSVDEGYMLTLARLANLETLNFSNITKPDRTNAEMFYLSRIGKAMAEVSESEEHIVTAQHRRYDELCELYGTPVVVRASSAAVHPDSLEARLIKFTMYLPAGSISDQDSDIIKVVQVPKGFDTYRVKGKVGRLFDLQPMKLRLIWETGEWDPVAGYEDDNSDADGEGKEIDLAAEATRAKGKYMKREVEIEDGKRAVGMWVDSIEAKVRVELRSGYS